jgi:hypothetical protein
VCADVPEMDDVVDAEAGRAGRVHRVPSGLKRAPLAPTASGSVQSSVTLSDQEREAAWAEEPMSRPAITGANTT